MGEVEDEDRWLEEVESEQALKWVREKNEGTLAVGLGNPKKKLRSFLMLRESPLTQVTKRGHFLYNIWMDENNPRGLWRRCSMEEYEKENPNWEIVLDIDALGKKVSRPLSLSLSCLPSIPPFLPSSLPPFLPSSLT
eukprot:3022754-Rhodomonas_salina.3